MAFTEIRAWRATSLSFARLNVDGRSRSTMSLIISVPPLCRSLLSSAIRIELAVFVAPAVEARSFLAREQVGTAHGRRRVLGQQVVELVGFARVLARGAVEQRR